MDGYSKDIVKEDIEKLRSIFPQCVVEGKVKIDQLLNILGEYEERDFEKYEFTWKGKNECYKVARERTKATLLPCESESVNFNDTQNIYIEGDNLEVLKILQQGYYNKIKMIYIDPPYNTGSDFVYKDNYKDSLANYKNIVSSTGKSNPETSGRFHTDWLNMMFPRLMLAYTLLKDDGVIFISIDDNEVDNLKKMCNEIFGEENLISSVIWKRKRGRDNSAKWFSKSHEYLLLYAKDKRNFNVNLLDLDEETKKAYKNPDNDKRGEYRLLATWARGTQGGVKYDFTSKNGIYFSERLWLFSKENLQKLDDDDKLVIKGDTIYRKLFLFENKGRIPETIWDNVSNSANASDEIKNIFKNIVFDTSKPIPYIKEMLKIITNSNSNDIILDFFSGSATTAHAVMQLNAEDGGNRKYIMVQLPQLCDEKTEAYKNGYKNICEIGKERIRRAGAKIKEEMENTENLDIGFRVFKLDSTNFNRWNVPLFEDIDINEYLNNAKEIVDDRTEVDAMFEILIKNGFPLTEKIYSLDVDNYKFYHIGKDCLVLVSFEKNIPIDVIEQAIEYVPAKLILTMDAFEDTSAMVTAKHIINKDYSIQFEILGENDVN